MYLAHRGYAANATIGAYLPLMDGQVEDAAILCHYNSWCEKR